MRRAPLDAVLFSNFATLPERFVKIFLNRKNGRHVRHKTAVFKMMIQAAVIKINRSARRQAIVCHAHFGVAKTRRPFKNAHAVFCKHVVKRTRHAVNRLFIRNPRRNDSDVDAAL